MEKHEYPKHIWHKEEGPKVVHSQDEHESLGKGWQEEPFLEEDEQASDDTAQKPRGRKKQASDDTAQKQES